MAQSKDDYETASLVEPVSLRGRYVAKTQNQTATDTLIQLVKQEEWIMNYEIHQEYCCFGKYIVFLVVNKSLFREHPYRALRRLPFSKEYEYTASSKEEAVEGASKLALLDLAEMVYETDIIE